VKYKGRKSAPIRSSIFSATLIANPFSWGQIMPAMKAPKIGCTPIMPVKKAEASAMRRQRAIML
jgi:hypothetical protein